VTRREAEIQRLVDAVYDAFRGDQAIYPLIEAAMREREIAALEEAERALAGYSDLSIQRTVTRLIEQRRKEDEE